mmetsp:Transcript_34566/g.87205  ORF Transcript_34566/g.87205 Transcript_34566/m.87205 type:complete len:278 (+) Transcript_34566:1497-2330(+)
MDAFRTPAPLPVDLPITSRISVNAQHDEQLLTRNEDQQTLRAYVPDPNLPWDPDTYCAPCKAWCDGGHCKIGMLIPTAGLVKGHQCARGKAFYHVISTGGTDDGHCSNDCMAAGTVDVVPRSVETTSAATVAAASSRESVGRKRQRSPEEPPVLPAAAAEATPQVLVQARAAVGDCSPVSPSQLANGPGRRAIRAQCGAAQAKQARVMRARVAAKAGPAPVVGDVVRVPLAKEDRGKVDPRFLTCVVSEVLSRPHMGSKIWISCATLHPRGWAWRVW